MVIEVDGSVCSRNIQSGKVVKKYFGPEPQVDKISFSPDEQSVVLQLLAKPLAQNVVGIDRQQGKLTDLSKIDETFLGAFRAAEGDFWISTNSSHQCLLRRSLSGPILRKRYGMPERPSGVIISEDCRYLAAWGATRTIYLWNLGGNLHGAKLVVTKIASPHLDFRQMVARYLVMGATTPYDSGIPKPAMNCCPLARRTNKCFPWLFTRRVECWFSESNETSNSGYGFIALKMRRIDCPAHSSLVRLRRANRPASNSSRVELNSSRLK